jgi:hypothetical protein
VTAHVGEGHPVQFIFPQFETFGGLGTEPPVHLHPTNPHSHALVDIFHNLITAAVSAGLNKTTFVPQGPADMESAKCQEVLQSEWNHLVELPGAFPHELLPMWACAETGGGKEARCFVTIDIPARAREQAIIFTPVFQKISSL